MSSSKPNSPDEDFFNDLSRQAYTSGTSLKSRPVVERHLSSDGGGQDGDLVPKSKRIACVLCRKRKLKCDGTRPSCGTCSRLAHSCAYDDIRRKSGPKRGYVKALEERLARMENLLRTNGSTNSESPRAAVDTSHTMTMDLDNTVQRLSTPEKQADTTQIHNGGTPGEAIRAQSSLSENYPSTIDAENPFEMIGLGLEEPLPPQEAINELHDIYFAKIHPSFPMIHRRRYFAAMNLAPHVRPPVCLRYIIWTLAASISDKYEFFAEHFYRRARKYAQADELRGHGEETITLAHCQTWALMSTYEFKLMYFPRAWLSTGRAVRLAQMMGLNRLDGKGLDVKQCIQPPKDWTEKEERRRTFWVVFCKDRYASIGTGWPMTIDERDIMTDLPCSDQAFDRSQAVSTCSLEDSLNKATSLSSHSSFSGVVMFACLFGRNLTHLHRPNLHDNESDLNGDFWTRHRTIDNILLNTSLGLPDHLRLPAGMTDPNVVFLNMCLHTATICLHQAAIFKADKNNLGLNVTNESKVRCITAATEVASYMRMISHIDLSAMNPFISFCLYVAARVFVQYLRSRPNEQQVRASLQFLLSAMQALRRKNPLTESFIAQLDVDIESSGVDGLRVDPHSIKAAQFANTDATTCTPLFQKSNYSRSDTANNALHGTSCASNTPQSHSSATDSPAIPSASGFTVPAVSDFKTGDTLDFVIPNPQGTVDLPSRQKSPPTIMDFSPENLSDRPTPSTSTSHRDSSSHTSFTSPDDPYAPQHRKKKNNNNNYNNNNNPSYFGLNSATSHASITAIRADANNIAGETVVTSPSQFFADTAAFDHLAANLYQPSMPDGVAGPGITSAQDELGMPATWDINGAAATTGMSIGPETGWQFENLEWLAGAGV